MLCVHMQGEHVYNLKVAFPRRRGGVVVDDAFDEVPGIHIDVEASGPELSDISRIFFFTWTPTCTEYLATKLDPVMIFEVCFIFIFILFNALCCCFACSCFYANL
jgi:hypothetical protein